MKRLLVLSVGALLIGSLPAGAASLQETKWVQGTVSSVSGSSITVKVKDKDMTFNVDSKTQVTAPGGSTKTRAAQAEGKSGPAFSELIKEGQGVEVRYHEAGMHAASIRVLRGQPSGTTSEEREMQKPKTASGTVSSVSASSLTIKGAKEEETFTIDEKTRVIGKGAGTKSQKAKEAGQKTQITDFVAEGDKVSVTYREEGTMKHATSVRVTAKGKAK